MVSGSEKRALEVVYDEGEEATSQMVSRRLGIDTGYARLLCMNLAHKDYVDLKSSGRFRITYKGKKALGKTSRSEEKDSSLQVPFERLARERSGWGVLSNVRSDRSAAPTFHKPGQEELVWNTSRVDSSGKHYSKGGAGIRVGKLLTEATHPCGFCKGKGEKPKGTKCPVCRGSGKISIAPPGVVCAYCKGRGEDKPRSNITCTVCRGKGFVSVKEPVTGCTRCRGRGSEPNNKLPCLECRGKGVISKKISMKEAAPSKPVFDRQIKFQMEQKERSLDRPPKQKRNPTASEIEVLQIYHDVKRQKRSLNVSSYTKMTPAYLGMMVRSLVENGFLAAIGPRRYEITRKGIELLGGKTNHLKADGFRA